MKLLSVLFFGFIIWHIPSTWERYARSPVQFAAIFKHKNHFHFVEARWIGYYYTGLISEKKVQKLIDEKQVERIK